MTRRVITVLIALGWLTLALGCGGSGSAVEGKVKVDSTDAFKRTKSSQAPPPKIPPP
jgi:hypothetical protein